MSDRKRLSPSPEFGVKSRYKATSSLRSVVNWYFPWFMLAFGLAVMAYLVREYFALVTLYYKRPWALYLLVIIPFLAWHVIRRDERRRPSLIYSRLSLLTAVSPGRGIYLRWLAPILRIMGLSLLIFIMSGPVVRKVHVERDEKGIDIVVALDISGSMENGDILPNRLEAAKEVVERFISKRPHDRIGLVLFGQNAYPYCPLTLDHKVVTELLRKVQLRTIDPGRATAIGDALGTALNMLRKSDAPTRVIILVTDGLNNSGIISPKEAADYASRMGVKIYTILMGDPNYRSRGLFGALLGPSRPTVNPKLLEEISAKTGGTSYLAADRAALYSKFQRILDQMERKTFVTKIVQDEDMGHAMLIPVFMLLGTELLLGWWLSRRLP